MDRAPPSAPRSIFPAQLSAESALRARGRRRGSIVIPGHADGMSPEPMNTAAAENKRNRPVFFG
jgi:hypothetical protein